MGINKRRLRSVNKVEPRNKSKAARSEEKLKDLLDLGFSTGVWSAQPLGYTVAGGYNCLRQKFPTVQWFKNVWNAWNIPKHRFINWLIARRALQLKDKLCSLGICSDDLCCICGRYSETHCHLFQFCEFTKLLLNKIAILLRLSFPYADSLQWIQAKP